jgi:hypothetical protein
MKQVWMAVAGILVAAARGRAEQVMRMQAEAGVHKNEDYRSNAGGWN